MITQKKILLVEDNPDDELLALKAFNNTGIPVQIDVVRSGEEALEYLFENPPSSSEDRLPDLIILDLNLPRVDGLDVLKEIKSEKTTQTIPVVIFTSSKNEDDIKVSYLLNVNSYIRKPVDFVKFREVAHLIGKYWLEVNESPPP